MELEKVLANAKQEVENLKAELRASIATASRYQMMYHEYRSAVGEVYTIGMIDADAFKEIESRAAKYGEERRKRTKYEN